MRRAPATLLVLLLAACAAALVACGGGGGDRDTRRRAGPMRTGDPVPAEEVRDAVDRVRGAATAGGCDAVKGLLHSTYGEISDAACRAVKAQIDGFRDPVAKAYRTGAVIDYRTVAGHRRAMALTLDADRTYRLDFIFDVPDRTLQTAKPAAFDRAAREVVRSMQSGDCSTFLRLVSRELGLGVGPDQEVCRRVSDLPFRLELMANRGATPQPLGGNGWLAFYKVRTGPAGYYTMVMVRNDDPAGQPRYVLVNALPAQ